MQRQDLGTLGSLALEDLVSVGGPSGREIGRDGLLEGAARFFAEAKIERWQTSELQVRRLGDTAVCSYEWTEEGTYSGERFAMAGLATDVLVLRDGRWRLQAHHVSPLPNVASRDDGKCAPSASRSRTSGLAISVWTPKLGVRS
jgi:uncharacterized protein (TIGR02246 family)